MEQRGRRIGAVQCCRLSVHARGCREDIARDQLQHGHGDHDDDGTSHYRKSKRAIKECGIKDRGEDDGARCGDRLHNGVGILYAQRHQHPSHTANKGTDAGHRSPPESGMRQGKMSSIACASMSDTALGHVALRPCTRNPVTTRNFLPCKRIASPHIPPCPAPHPWKGLRGLS
eukprot:scaffold293712_cov32-Tisochrysis_lutea.AAC.4